jgi:deoxyadenosine/deoxycytidine kinase
MKELINFDFNKLLDKRSNEHNYYICVSGNSATGKSTALKELSIYTDGFVIDEKTIHHPLIECLFYDSENYSFQIQLNFMLQRHLLAKRITDLGYNLIMERSHLEDKIFIEHLREQKYIDDYDYITYIRLWNSLDRRLRHPDIILFLDVEADISYKRLCEAEENGERIKEFKNEEQKKIWLTSWSSKYKNLFNKKNQNIDTEIIEVKNNNIKDILPQINEVLTLKGKNNLNLKI